MADQNLTPSKRSGALDLLRFLAVIGVFFGHYTDTFNVVYKIVPENLKYTVLSKYAALSLLIFFMVSGYVVSMTSIKRSLKDFAITRLSRIYPLFWVSCIVAYILPKVIHTHSYLGNYPLKTLLINLTMIPLAFGTPMINPVFHTMAIELMFYILIAVIIAFKLWDRLSFVIAFMLFLCIVNIVFLSIPVYIIVLPFLAGMTCYLIHENKTNVWQLYTLFAVNFICALISSKPLAHLLDEFSRSTGNHDTGIIMSVITLIYLVFLCVSLKVIYIPSKRFFQFLGEIAYSFYLFHIYFLCFYWYFRETIQSDLLLYGILLSTVLVSWLINSGIEKPLSKIAGQILTSITDLFKQKDSLSSFRIND